MYMCYKTYILQMYWFQVITRDKDIPPSSHDRKQKTMKPLNWEVLDKKVLDLT